MNHSRAYAARLLPLYCRQSISPQLGYFYSSQYRSFFSEGKSNVSQTQLCSYRTQTNILQAMIVYAVGAHIFGLCSQRLRLLSENSGSAPTSQSCFCYFYFSLFV